MAITSDEQHCIGIWKGIWVCRVVLSLTLDIWRLQQNNPDTLP